MFENDTFSQRKKKTEKPKKKKKLALFQARNVEISFLNYYLNVGS